MNELIKKECDWKECKQLAVVTCAPVREPKVDLCRAHFDQWVNNGFKMSKLSVDEEKARYRLHL